MNGCGGGIWVKAGGKKTSVAVAAAELGWSPSSRGGRTQITLKMMGGELGAGRFNYELGSSGFKARLSS